MILETIQQINAKLETIAGSQISGLAMVTYSQQDKANTLLLPLEQKQLVVDSRYKLQTAHLQGVMNAAGTTQYGSYSENQYTALMVLFGRGQSATDVLKAMEAVKTTAYVRIRQIDQDTQAVLQRYWQIRPGPGKNYDPSWWAWAITYEIHSISDQDIIDFNTVLAEAEQLNND